MSKILIVYDKPMVSGFATKRSPGREALSLEAAARVFEDPGAVSFVERVVEGPERWHTIGLAGGIAILLVVHTVEEENGEEKVRIISARKAAPRERALYRPPA